MKKETSPFGFDEIAEKFFDTVFLSQKSLLLITASELDIFTIIGEDYKTAEEVAEQIPADPRKISRLLNALVANGFLKKSGLKYSNTKETYAYLVRGNSNFIGNLKPYKKIIQRWLELTSVLKNNDDNYPSNLFTSEELENFLNLMNWRISRQAPEILSKVDLKRVTRVLDLGCGSGTLGMEVLKYNINVELTLLDLGCGSGTLGMEVLKYNINVELTLFDLPEVAEHTKKFVERKGFNDFVKVVAGDLFQDDIGKDYDLVIVSNLLRFYSFRQCLSILNKVFNALKNKGKILINETLFNNDRTQPVFATMQSIDLLLLTPNGDLLTETEVILLLKEAWFSNIVKYETSFGSTVFIGEK